MKRHTVAEVMTTDVVTVRDTSDYKDIVDALMGRGISAVPVVDEAGAVVGVVSEADLLYKVEFTAVEPHRQLFERKRSRAARAKAGAESAADLMTAPAVVVTPTATTAAAARLMDEHQIKRLPVVDEDGRLVGVVSRSDLLWPFLRGDESILDEIRDEVILRTMWIDPNTIAVSVQRGVVTLGGELERRSSVPIVVGLVRAVAGVVDVVDQFTYRHDDTHDRGYHPNPPILA